jgi:hypothetical protein
MFLAGCPDMGALFVATDVFDTAFCAFEQEYIIPMTTKRTINCTFPLMLLGTIRASQKDIPTFHGN